MDESVYSLSVASVCGLSTNHDKLKEALIKYREAVTTSSPGLPLRLPWVSVFLTRLNPDGVVSTYIPLPNVAAERQRWAGGRYRFAVEGSVSP